MNDLTWGYDLEITNCISLKNTTLCPLLIRSCASPFPDANSSSVNCSSNSDDCTLRDLSASIGKWHYIEFNELGNSTISFVLIVKLRGELMAYGTILNIEFIMILPLQLSLETFNIFSVNSQA